MRLYEGNILTCDKENRIAHYLLEDQGKILYCGGRAAGRLCGGGARVHRGGALIPPFVDSHIHFRKLRDVSCRAQCHECAEQ